MSVIIPVCEICTLTFLINSEALIKGEDGFFFKIDKRGGSNNRGGWKICQNLIKGEGQVPPKKIESYSTSIHKMALFDDKIHH